ncbi:octanoyl-[acyl-carrier-protein]:protein N-octanoyltransferase LIPT2, mitochondrial isoform X2 [Columba livia]|uniref:octanoyl-[acyl-carrier-protein]:protein N-octanoyltransferase LIPT2, mitochondrial isoform X2 n=1 Tax=Columba livia TaxID=8932 RepID=UPI0031BA6F36
MSRAPVRVLRLGLCPYPEALRVQERCVAAARAARPGPVPAPTPAPTAGESVVLSEPAAPVYVWGLRGAPEAEAAARLRARGAGLLAARRGGHITFHGPGQLLAFPVLDLRRRRLPLRGYVAALEALVVRMCRRFGLAAARALPPPFTGVWMGDSKVCAIGERGGGTRTGGTRTGGALREPHHLARAGAELLHRPHLVRPHRPLRAGGKRRHVAEPRAGPARHRRPRPPAFPRLLPGGVRLHLGVFRRCRGAGEPRRRG